MLNKKKNDNTDVKTLKASWLYRDGPKNRGKCKKRDRISKSTFAAPNVVISLVNNYPRISKTLGKWLLENKNFTWSQRIPPQITYREENVPLQWRALVTTTSSKWQSLSPTKLEGLTIWHHLCWHVARNDLNQIKPCGSNQTDSECETRDPDSSKKKKNLCHK